MASDTSRKKTSEEKKNYAKIVVMALVIIALTGLGLAARVVRDTANDSERTVNTTYNIVIAGRDARVEFQANLNWMLCSRDASLVTPEKRDDYKEVCEGYDTPEQALKTEKSKQEAKEKANEQKEKK